MANLWRSRLQISRGVKGGRCITRDGQRANVDELTAGDIAALYGLPDDGEDGDLGDFELTLRRRSLAAAHLPALSDRQADVLMALEKLTSATGYPPSIRELGEEVGLRSTCTVHVHVNALIRKGYVARRHPGASRALVVLHSLELPEETMERIRKQEAATEAMVNRGRRRG